ncbi:uncharacterized protein [Musca autumnalis]|uniref:uncharacterized protein n=1 Tax=Musca autumnalis TaxID=221902 RepID=UPI003CFB2DB9
MVCSATETERIISKSSGQQTLAYNKRKSTSVPRHPPPPIRYFFSKSVQTEIQTTTCGIQCKCRTLTTATQTDDVVMTSSSTQVYNIGDVLEKSLDFPTPISAEKSTEPELIIYMLNEIGELVINQNHLIGNNTKLLNQLTEMSVLNKKLKMDNVWSNRTRRLLQSHKRIRNPCLPKRVRYCKFKETKNRDKSSKSTQTESMLFTPKRIDTHTQTSLEVYQRKSWFHRKTNKFQ